MKHIIGYIVVLAIGAGIGASSHPTPPAAATTTETPTACATALDLADAGFGAMGEAMRATLNGDANGYATAMADLDPSTYKAAERDCLTP